MYNTEELIQKTIDHGFTKAGKLNPDALIFRTEVRAMCAADKCRHYGKTWSCPPGCGTLDDSKKRVTDYSFGIIVESVAQLEDEFDFETIEETSKNHAVNFRKLIDDLRAEYKKVFPMSAGTCNLCGKCTYPDSPCRYPDKQFISMEAYGLWVSDVCEKSGVPYYNGKNTVTFVSCFLLP